MQTNTILILIASTLLIASCGNDTSVVPRPINYREQTTTIPSQRMLHEQEMGQYNFTTEHEWDSLNQINTNRVLHKEARVSPNIRTFGWHVYSNGSAWKNYNFSMLWGLSYFSYVVQPETGGYKTIHQWKTTALIDRAQAADCKVLLSLANFGDKNNALFLNNLKAQQTLVDSISNLLALRSANGINIDFEGVAKKDRKRFTNFIVSTSKKLKQINPNYMISLCLYAKDWHDIFDIEALDQHIDFYTLMGYDYYGAFSKHTGPVSPLNNSAQYGKGLKNTVQHYMNKGVTAKKLIIGLPYYGAQWLSKGNIPGAPVASFIDHPPYKNIRKYHIDSSQTTINFDTVSASSYLIASQKNGKFSQLFFEDSTSLALKYDWIKAQEFAGVGIWALGYDNGYSELWELLAEKFSVAATRKKTQ